jgi:Ribosomal protein L7/L12
MSKYQVSVITAPGNIVPLVKSLRLAAGLGLKDAKSLADYLRKSGPQSCVLVAGVEQEVAERIAELFQDVGRKAEVQESAIANPMLLCPEANEKYSWHWLYGPMSAE